MGPLLERLPYAHTSASSSWWFWSLDWWGSRSPRKAVRTPETEGLVCFAALFVLVDGLVVSAVANKLL